MACSPLLLSMQIFTHMGSKLVDRGFFFLGVLWGVL